MKAYSVFLASLFMSMAAIGEDIPTRYGNLSIRDSSQLLFNGRSLEPRVDGDPDLTLFERFQLTNTDLVILQSSGGSSCPAHFYFFAVSDTGIKASDAVGTCSAQVQARRTADTISITMPGFAGPFEPAAAQAKAAKERHVYLYKAGVVTADGKPVRFDALTLGQQIEPTQPSTAEATSSADDKRKYLSKLVAKHSSAIKSLGFSSSFLNGTMYLQVDAFNRPVSFVKFHEYLAMLFESGDFIVKKISFERSYGVQLKRPGARSAGLLFKLDGGEIFPSHYVSNDQVIEIETIQDQVAIAMLIGKTVDK